MNKTDFTLEFIKENQGLRRLAESLATESAFALDIETTEWWNRQREQVSLIQLAFRHGGQAKVAVVDALADLDFEILRHPFEAHSIVKSRVRRAPPRQAS
jgi:ribonuclease D